MYYLKKESFLRVRLSYNSDFESYISNSLNIYNNYIEKKQILEEAYNKNKYLLSNNSFNHNSGKSNNLYKSELLQNINFKNNLNNSIYQLNINNNKANIDKNNYVKVKLDKIYNNTSALNSSKNISLNSLKENKSINKNIKDINNNLIADKLKYIITFIKENKHKLSNINCLLEDELEHALQQINNKNQLFNIIKKINIILDKEGF